MILSCISIVRRQVDYGTRGIQVYNAAVQNKNAMCEYKADTSIKSTNSIQIRLSTSRAKKLYLYMFDVVDSAFNYKREWIVCRYF